VLPLGCFGFYFLGELLSGSRFQLLPVFSLEGIADSRSKTRKRIVVDREQGNVSRKLYDPILVAEALPDILGEIEPPPLVCGFRHTGCTVGTF